VSASEPKYIHFLLTSISGDELIAKKCPYAVADGLNY
jgi:hypothetical protein